MAVLSFFYFCEKLLEFTNELGVIFNIIILNKRIRCLNPSQHQSQPKIPTILLSSSSVFLHPCNRHHHYCGCRHHCLVACRSGAQFLPEHLPGPFARAMFFTNFRMLKALSSSQIRQQMHPPFQVAAGFPLSASTLASRQRLHTV